MRTLETDIAIIGAGGAGMAAAIAASEAGSRSILIDRSLIGRGGATVMAQMTVAAAVGAQTEDHWTHHLKDTLAAGRGLCDERLARLLCEEGVAAIRRLQDWKVGWAAEDGHLKQVQAPGHDRPRCVYVDFLNTGPAVSKTLRTQVIRHDLIRRVGDLYAVDIVQRDGAPGARAADVDAPAVAQAEPLGAGRIEVHVRSGHDGRDDHAADRADDGHGNVLPELQGPANGRG